MRLSKRHRPCLRFSGTVTAEFGNPIRVRGRGCPSNLRQLTVSPVAAAGCPRRPHSPARPFSFEGFFKGFWVLVLKKKHITKIETKSEGTTKLDCPEVTVATPTGPVPLPYTVSQGNQGDFTLEGCDLSHWAEAGFTVGQKGKVDITVTYNTVKSGTNFPHLIKGDIFATVQ